jgi:hypothetical protein
VSNQYSRRRRSREQKRAEASKLYGWPNDPRYWNSRYASWNNEPQPEPDIYLLQAPQTASHFLIGLLGAAKRRGALARVDAACLDGVKPDWVRRVGRYILLNLERP